MKRILWILISLSIGMSVCSCGLGTRESADNTTNAADTEIRLQQTQSWGSSEMEATEQKEYSEMTETELRSALSSFSDKSDALNNKAECYRELIALDVATSEDYLAYANVCKELGMEAEAATLMEDRYVLFPSEDSLKELSEWVTYIDTCPAWAEKLNNDEDILALLKEVTESENWLDEYGWSLKNILRRTMFSSEEETVEINASSSLNRIVIEVASGESVYFSITSNAITCCEKKTTDNRYDFSMSVDSGDEGLTECKGTIKDGYVVGDFEITLSGKKYLGSFDENGKAMSEQIKGVSGVIYAYTADGKEYIYQEGGDIDEFRITEEYLGIPAFSLE